MVYTDGSCFNNGRKGARAGIGVYWGPEDVRWENLVTCHCIKLSAVEISHRVTLYIVCAEISVNA